MFIKSNTEISHLNFDGEERRNHLQESLVCKCQQGRKTFVPPFGYTCGDYRKNPPELCYQ
jgi:hypothetical protein